MTASGNVRFAADRGPGGHADRFWALALGIHAGKHPAAPVEYEAIPRPDDGPDDGGFAPSNRRLSGVV